MGVTLPLTACAPPQVVDNNEMMYERLLIAELYKRLVTRTKNEDSSLFETQERGRRGGRGS